MNALTPLSMFAALAIVAISGCTAPTTRAISDGGTGPATGVGPTAPAPTGPPVLNGVEREIRDGKLTIRPGGAAKTVKRRVAVVIGNSAYRHVSKLGNPTRDARAMAALLKKNGFEVLQGIDVSKRRFEDLLRQAVLAGGPGADIVAYYAGHGFQIGAKNFLVPVDAKLTGANDLPFQTVRLRTLQKIMKDRSGRHLSFLDSCRNNPFAGKKAKTGITRAVTLTSVGFSAPSSVPRDGFVAYATQPGAVAYDGDGQPNSPFTAALLRNIQRNPTASITSTLRRVRASVRSATSGEQVPAWTSRLSRRFAFKPRPERVAAIPASRAGDPRVAIPKTGTPKLKTPAKARIKPMVTVNAPMEQVVAVGGRVAEKLALPKNATVKIVKPPAEGTVATVGTSATTTAAILKPVPASKIGAMVYVMPPKPKIAPSRYKNAVKSQEIVAEVKIPGKPPTMVTVNLRLAPDPCDFLAGDWLDMQGVRLYRPGREFNARRAIRACRTSIERAPRNGRFHFLLGKAYAALKRWQPAVNAYRRAARLGHIRANYALGTLAMRVQGPGPIAFNYFQIGSNAGDPLAIAGLGRLMLETAPSLADREKAFELLAFAVDLGIPEAMRTLADHFGKAGTPDFDRGRAGAFLDAARAREGRLRLLPPRTGRISDPVDFSGPGGDANDGGGAPGGGQGGGGTGSPGSG